MKARNLLKLFCKFREDSDFQIAQAVAERLELDLNRWVGLMSTGMRQKLALAICLSNQASLLILDEPTANLDPTVRGQVMEIIREAKDSGRTVVFSSHVLSEIEDTCDRVGILRSGELVHLESMVALNRQHRITASLNGDMPDPPDGLADVSVKQVGQRIQIETPGELSAVLKWLADAPLTDVSVQPVGLRSVYDRFHHPASIVSKTEAKG
jgi:ABC-2 type transport system ATP-binding protein